MIGIFGNLLIILNIALTALIIFFTFETLKRINQKNIKIVNNLILLQLTTTIMSFLTLVSAFVLTDLSLVAVYNNSHISKPLFYKISGTWGNHEGSLMLWVLVLVIFSFLFFIFNKNNHKYSYLTLIIQNIIIFAFLGLLLINSNPFQSVVPTPKEGLGLNPILQDPALAIHPPLLYLGFVGSSIFFSAAISSLLSGFEGKGFAISIKPWVLISWFFQSLGIIVGSIWAYYELGWGGYWFWDPVENASLMPWFIMAALAHSVIVLEKRNNLYHWVILLCLLTFILSVTGTFLVRSGILNSVHTFASDADRGVYILSFLSIMILSSIIIFFKNVSNNNKVLETSNKSMFILTNNWFMIFYLITVFVGTIYPIVTEIIFNSKISVGPPFYNILIAPIIVPFMFLMSLGPETTWNKASFLKFKKLTIILTLSILMNYFFHYYLNSKDIISNLLIISSLFLIIYTISDLYKILARKNYYSLSRVISHLGFGFLILFISLNHNLSEEHDFNLKVGEIKKLENYQINFENIIIEEKDNFKSLKGYFEVVNIKQNYLKILNPEIRIYDTPETITYEASIKSNLKQDYFITMSNIGDGDIFNIKFQKNLL